MLSFRALFGDEATVLRETNFQVLLLAMAVVPLGNGLISPILDTLIDPFGATPASIGLMITFFWAPSILVVPVAGVLADRYGRKTVLVPSIVLFGAAGLGIAATTDYRVVLGLRSLQGVGWAGISPLIITSVGDLYEGAKEATAQGLRITGAGLPAAAFPLVGGALVVVGWQTPFFVYVAAFPVAATVYLWFDEPTAESADAAADGGQPTTYLRALFGLVRQRRVLAIVIARALPLMVWIGFITYNSIIVVRLLDGTPFEAGVLLGLASLVFAIGASQAGRTTARFDSRFTPLLVANVCLGIGVAAVLVAPAIAVAAVGIVVAGIGFGIAVSLYTSILTGLAPPALRGGLVSVGATTARLVGTVTPVLMGVVIATGTPVIGFASSVQLAGLGAVVVGAGGSIIGLLVARRAPPVSAGIEDAPPGAGGAGWWE